MISINTELDKQGKRLESKGERERQKNENEINRQNEGLKVGFRISI